MVKLAEKENGREDGQTACIIKVDGRIEKVYPENGLYFELEEMQKIVGGYIQVLFCNNGMRMIVDEEGKLKGYAPNLIATEMVYALTGEDYICGNVLLCDQTQIR